MKILLYILLGCYLTFMLFSVILAILGDVENSEKLKEKQNKAIDYIKNHQDLYTYNTFGKDLLEILGDEDDSVSNR